jgi:glycosyltransferase involved in cell wall biosynthesis
MRIAQVAPLTEAVPPKLYGGTERVVHWLTEELVALGNDVTLFASGDSQTSAKLDATWPKALRLDGSVRDPNALHMVMLERVRQKCDDEEFDFLHFHLDYYPFSLFARQPTPFLTTLHGRLDLPEHQPVFNTFSSIPVISISNAQRRPVPQANWVRTIHHGLPENLLTPRPVTPSYLAVLGRIAPEKGVDRAIKIATRCGIPLKIAAKIDRADQEYYDEIIHPLMDHSLVEYIGEIGDHEKSDFLSGWHAEHRCSPITVARSPKSSMTASLASSSRTKPVRSLPSIGLRASIAVPFESSLRHVSPPVAWHSTILLHIAV